MPPPVDVSHAPASSKHRVHAEDDLDELMWVACLADHIPLRQRYVGLKIYYWRAVQARDDARVDLDVG